MAGDAMNINDEGTSNAAYWHERAMKAEARLAEAQEQAKADRLVVDEAYRNERIAKARLQKIMARCADLLDEDQFNELDAMMRTTVTVSEVPHE